MKVKDLIEVLQECDPEAEVILQSDSEGNGYSPLNGVDDDTLYAAETTYSGEVYPLKFARDYDPEYFKTQKDWDEFTEDMIKCVVLFPIN